MRVFVTGGTGFVGGHVVERLVSEQHEVRCLVRQPDRVPNALLRAGVELVKGDLADEDALRRGLASCDGVVHLASVNTHWEPDPSIYRRVNVDGLRNVMRGADAAGAQVVVNMGTALAFGRPKVRPFTEESERGKDLFTSYGRSKNAGDRIAKRMQRESGLPLVTIYPGGIVGPGNVKQTSQYIHTVLEGKLPAIMFPNARHTYVHVGDVAEMVARSLVTPAAIGRDYLAGNESLSMQELNLLLVELTGVKLPRLRLPGLALHLASMVTTAVADLTDREPLMGLARGSVLHMAAGCYFDGSRATRELGVEYTPLRDSIAGEIAGYAGSGAVDRTGAPAAL